MQSRRSIKKGTISFTSIEFILNLIAISIMIASIGMIIRSETHNITYSANEHYRLELEYLLFSEEGVFPDRITFNHRFINQLDRISLQDTKIKDIGIKITIDDQSFYINEIFFKNYYALRNFKKYVYGNISKPIIFDNEVQIARIEYIFKGEEVVKITNVNS